MRALLMAGGTQRQERPEVPREYLAGLEEGPSENSYHNLDGVIHAQSSRYLEGRSPL